MRIAVYGGSFNPPHLGHIEAAKSVVQELAPDRFLIVPAATPPHKALAEDSPSAEQRMELCRLAFAGIPGAEISDIELRRGGKSYTYDTVAALRAGEDLLSDAVYAEIIRRRYYGAKPELTWLRGRVLDYLDEYRVAHVAGCESEAVSLARRWGEDPELAAEAAILHDITKRCTKDQQLQYCEKYGIINDNSELENKSLLHAKTGAALARDLFGVDDAVYEAIRWHTTGKPDMTRFEKILYLADYIEPTRDFEGIEELRALAYEDLDAAMALGLKMTIEEIRRSGREVFIDTLNAYDWYNEKEK